MDRASFALKILLATTFLMLKADGGNADASKTNPLATLTEITVSFKPIHTSMQVNCTIRYDASESAPISLFYNNELIQTESNSSILSHDIEDAEAGEYKCTAGSSEFIFHVPRNMSKLINLDVVEIAFYANLVTGQTKIGYESTNENNIFQCYQEDIEMEEAFHDILTGVESKGYNGTLKQKTQTDYKCLINTEQFDFSATSNVEDLYPRINAFEVDFTPNQRGDFILYVSCQTRTANNPKIMLFVNQSVLVFKRGESVSEHEFVLVESKRGDFASHKTNYVNQAGFKCIVENEYGRDVISWGGQKLEKYLNRKDSFRYVVNPDKEITKTIFRPGQPRNLDNVRCSVEEKNKEYQYSIDLKSDKKKVFIDAIDKFVRYTYQLSDDNEFQTEMYTKDWLKVPQLSDVMVTAKPHRDIYSVDDSCFESVQPFGSSFAMSLFDGDKLIITKKEIWRNSSHGFFGPRAPIATKELTKIRCVVENDIGYDLLIVDFKTKVPEKSQVHLWIGLTAENNITSKFNYTRPTYKKETTNCEYNKTTAFEKNYFYLKQDKQHHGEYSCISYAKNCKTPANPETCRTEMKLTWTRMLMNYFPDGSLKPKDPSEKYLSFYGFY